jgi:hypothetical protein
MKVCFLLPLCCTTRTDASSLSFCTSFLTSLNLASADNLQHNDHPRLYISLPHGPSRVYICLSSIEWYFHRSSSQHSGSVTIVRTAFRFLTHFPWHTDPKNQNTIVHCSSGSTGSLSSVSSFRSLIRCHGISCPVPLLDGSMW